MMVHGELGMCFMRFADACRRRVVVGLGLIIGCVPVQKEFGKCESDWMIEQGLCEFSCGRCECDAAAAAATDVADATDAVDAEDAAAGMNAAILQVL